MDDASGKMSDPQYDNVDVSTGEDMPRLTKRASKKAKRTRMREELHKYKEGKLHSGSKTGRVVKSRAQAIAIGLNESGQSKKRSRKRKHKR